MKGRRLLWHPGPLLLGASVIQLAIGMAIHILPQEFQSPAYAPVQPFLRYLALACVSGGIVLLTLLRYRLADRVRQLLAALGAAPLLVLATNFALTRVWTGLAFYGVLGLAVAVSPWLPPSRAAPNGQPRIDLLALILGTVQALQGLAFLGLPGAWLGGPLAPFQPWFSLAGTCGLVGAICLVVWGLAPDRRSGW